MSIDSAMKRILSISVLAALSALLPVAYAQSLRLNDSGLFESRGVEVSVCKDSEGIKVVQKDRVVAPFGGVSVDGLTRSAVLQNNINLAENKVEVKMSASDSFTYYLKVAAKHLGFEVSVYLTDPLPESLSGKVKFSMDFLPSLYYGKNCLMDGKARIIPESISPGHSLILAPENDELRIEIKSDEEICCSAGDKGLEIYSKIPSGRTGNVLVWYVEPSYDSRWAKNAIPDWSRIGYLNGQEKVAVVEVDAKEEMAPHIKVYKISDEGYRQQVYQAATKRWGRAGERSDYLTANFSAVREDGVYCIEYNNVFSDAFPISCDVLDGKWHNAMKLLSERIVSGTYDSAEALGQLVDLWESFRPELDFNGNGVADAVDAIVACTERMTKENLLAVEMTSDKEFQYIAALAGAGRVLKDFASGTSAQAQNLAWQLWGTSNQLVSDKKVDAVVQMWLLTGDNSYKKQITSILDNVLLTREGFCRLLPVCPLLDAKLQKKFNDLSSVYSSSFKKDASSTPYSVPVLGSVELMEWAMAYYQLWNRFPGELDSEVIIKSLDSLYGNRTYADEAFLDSLDVCSLIRFIKISLAADEIAKYVNTK